MPNAEIVRDTDALTWGGQVVSGPMPLREAMQEGGVYWVAPHPGWKPRAPSVAIVVQTDACVYVNDNYVCDVGELGYTGDEEVWLTDINPPAAIILPPHARKVIRK